MATPVWSDPEPEGRMGQIAAKLWFSQGRSGDALPRYAARTKTCCIQNKLAHLHLCISDPLDLKCNYADMRLCNAYIYICRSSGLQRRLHRALILDRHQRHRCVHHHRTHCRHHHHHHGGCAWVCLPALIGDQRWSVLVLGQAVTRMTISPYHANHHDDHDHRDGEDEDHQLFSLYSKIR